MMNNEKNEKIKVVKSIDGKSVDDLILEIINAKKQTLKELAYK